MNIKYWVMSHFSGGLPKIVKLEVLKETPKRIVAIERDANGGFSLKDFKHTIRKDGTFIYADLTHAQEKYTSWMQRRADACREEARQIEAESAKTVEELKGWL